MTMTQRLHISLSQLQSRISIAVEDAFDRPVWVGAEVAEMKVNASGHCYLELIEKGAQRTATATARGVIWRSNFAALARRFEAESGRALTAGMKILAKVTVSYHPLYGLTLQIVDLDPSYTLGDIEQRKRATIEQLQRDGVWEMNHTLPLPRVIQRVAVVSSATAAGYRDFMREIEAHPYNITTSLFEALMQGEEAEQSIVAALMAIAERCDDFDAVAIIRGGGSTGDLDCYNSYALASFVAQFPLPVLTGVGHDKDVSIADMVAAQPLKTPTAVAAWICDRAATFDGELEGMAIALRELALRLQHSAELAIQNRRAELQVTVQRIVAEQLARIDNGGSTLKMATKALLQREHQRLASNTALTENFTPRRLMQMGFAIARAEGKALRSIRGIEQGDKVTIEVTDGTLTAEVIETKERIDG